MSEKRTDLKFDGAKPRYDLIPQSAYLMGWTKEEFDGVARVLEHGVVKYEEDSWKDLEGAMKRYRAAGKRHQKSIEAGETHCPDSGLPHYHHYLANIAFLVDLGARGVK